MAPALEAVAGTLTHLHLEGWWGGDKVRVGYELGMAVGKLRRLQDLALGLSEDGRVCHAVAQGLAASGGGDPLPLLWRVGVLSRVRAHGDLVASLVLPSVRVFILSDFVDERSALLMACGLRQVGYKHAWALGRFAISNERIRGFCESLRSIAPSSRLVGMTSAGYASKRPPWIITPVGGLSSPQTSLELPAKCARCVVQSID
jgi:hypothetical protein